jgi:deoxyribose-phosphate aldolase
VAERPVSEPLGLTRRQLAAVIDHTLLKPEATTADVERVGAEARHFGVFAVCVSPTMVPTAAAAVADTGIAVASVVGFPSGAHCREVKAAEAARAVADGAGEIDMVIDLGAARAGAWDAVRDEIGEVRAAVGRLVVLKVIIESALWDDGAITAVCRAAEAAGADFVKTSTGFHPAGGASLEAVRVMADTVGGRLGIKASGGISSAAQALALLEAGATRLGLSRSAAILAELD